MHQETLPLDWEEPSEGDDVSDEDDYYVRVSNGTGNYEVRGSALVSLYLSSLRRFLPRTMSLMGRNAKKFHRPFRL